MKISEIEIGERHRKDLGNIEELAESIKEVGLLQPVTVEKESNTLIDGYRRIEAYKLLGKENIPVRKISVDNIIAGEYHANVFRKDFTPLELADIGSKLEPELKEKARERQMAGGSANFAEGERGDVRDQVGEIFGVSGFTYEKSKFVAAAARENPKKFEETANRMDSGDISIDRAYRQVKREKDKEKREKKAKEMPKPPALDRGDLPLNEVICGDCIEVMNQLPENSIHMVMFSPGYWGLRDYGMDGQIGMEDDYRNYIQKLVKVGRAIKQVLRPDGSWYLNLGDTYAGSQGRKGEAKAKESWEWQDGQTPQSQIENIPPKCKMLMPHRIALALIDDGWICRNDIVWHKPNPMPSSVKDRLNTTYEFVFHFVQQGDYWYDLDAIREPHKSESVERDKYAYNTAMGARAQVPNEKRDKPDQKKIARFLKPKVRGHEELLDKVFGKHKWRHWIRTDESGATLPSPDDWKLLKEVIEFGDGFDEEMLETRMVPVTDEGHPKGKNPGDFWQITTQPFPDAHFAVYPEELCLKPIKSSCPPKVCARCGKPYMRITEKKTTFHSGSGKAGNPPSGKYGKNWAQAKSGSYDIRMGPRTSIKFKGWQKTCGCETDETKPGIVLDPMAGSGTTGLAAKKLGRDFVLIELNPDYVEMAEERIQKV